MLLLQDFTDNIGSANISKKLQFFNKTQKNVYDSSQVFHLVEYQKKRKKLKKVKLISFRRKKSKRCVDFFRRPNISYRISSRKVLYHFS
jgi:predicted RecB family nuclease